MSSSIETSSCGSIDSVFPFERFPEELLSQVFVAALHVVQCAYDIPPVSIRQAPMNLSHTCRRWRDMALSIPQLWAQIYFDINNHESFAAALSIASSVSSFVERSGNSTLSIKMILHLLQRSTIKDATNNDWIILAKATARPILEVQHRWRKVEIAAPPGVWQHGYDSHGCRTLNVSAGAEDFNFFLTRGFNMGILRRRAHPFVTEILSGSRLERIVIGDGIGMLSVDNSASFPRLRKFHLASASPMVYVDTVFQVLDASPILRDLYLALPLEQIGAAEITKRLCLQKLRKLHLIAHDGRVEGLRNAARCTSGVLNRLVLPSLQYLKVYVNDEGEEAGDVALRLCDLIQISNPPLTSLSVSIKGVQPEDLLLCLESTPMLERLSFDLRPMDPASVIMRLTASTINGDLHAGPGDGIVTLPNVCPSLRELIVKGANTEEPAFVAIVAEFLLSRSPPGDQRYVDPEETTRTLVVSGTQNEGETNGDDLANKARSGTSVLSKITFINGPEAFDGINIADIAPLIERGLKLDMYSEADWDSDSDDDDDDDDRGR